jgi:hypothetical protein
VEILPDEIKEYKDVGERLISALDRYSTANGNMSNIAEVKINAGGLGVLLVTGFAAFMCGLCLAMMFIVFRQEKKIDNMQDYLNVIYQYAPQLKPGDSHVSDNHHKSTEKSHS